MYYVHWIVDNVKSAHRSFRRAPSSMILRLLQAPQSDKDCDFRHYDYSVLWLSSRWLQCFVTTATRLIAFCDFRHGTYSVLWLPSQNPGLLVSLQVHRLTVFVSVASIISGVNSPPLWEPSQKGWLLDSPQVHHAYFLPASTSTLIGVVPAIFGFAIDNYCGGKVSKLIELSMSWSLHLIKKER